ncbi:MAG: hypothetical protein V3T77_01260 [Planctomycetota bacterium]
MTRHRWIAVLVTLSLLVGAGSPAFAGSPGVGGSAPELTPMEWLNHSGPISWEALAGQLVLVEKWATW